MDDAVTTLIKEILPTLGVGGAIAALVFYYARRDRADSDARFDRMQEVSDARFIEILKRQETREAALIEVVQENSSSSSKLATVIEGLQRTIEERSWRRPVGPR